MVNHHAEVVRLRAEGYSYRAIGKLTGYHASTVWTIVRQHLAETAPSREDADRLRAMLFAEHEAVKEQLVPFVFAEDDDGNPCPPDAVALAAHLARAKEQAELYHLHGKQDEVTQHGGGVSAHATAKAERTQRVMQLLHEKGLDGQPDLEVPSAGESPEPLSTGPGRQESKDTMTIDIQTL